MSYDMSSVLVSLTINSTLVLTLAFVLVGLARHLSSSERHFIWCITFFCLSLLPILIFVVPKYHLPVSIVDFTRPLEIDIAVSGKQTSKIIDKSLFSYDGSILASYIARLKEMGSRQTVILIYFSIATLFLLYLGVVYLRISRSLNLLYESHNPDILKLVRNIRQQLGVNRDVRVFECDIEKTPWTWGLLNPKIILPVNFTQWSSEDQYNALVHEISHVKRKDLASFILARICCCLYWFHPFVWIAHRKMLIEAERACDDQVLLSGAKASAYANQLIDVANSIFQEHTQKVLANAMASHSTLSHRIKNILNGNVRRNLISRKTLTITFPLTFIFLISLVAVRADGGDSQISNENTGSLGDSGASRESEEKMYMVRKIIYKKLTMAERLIQGEDYEQGLSILKELQTNIELSDYEKAQVYNYLAYTYYTLGRNQEAIHAYENILNQSFVPDSLKLNSVYTLAKLYFIDNNFPKAVEYINRWLTEAEVPTENAYTIQGQAYFQLKQYRESLAPLEKAYALVNKRGDTPTENSLLLLRKNYSVLKMYKDANRISEKLEGLYPGFQHSKKPEIGMTNNISSEYLPVFKVPPLYPPNALSKGIEGYVIVEFTVTKEGTTRDIFVAKAEPEDIFNESAINTAATFIFKPRIVKGVPVEVHGIKNKITFSME